MGEVDSKKWKAREVDPEKWRAPEERFSIGFAGTLTEEAREVCVQFSSNTRARILRLSLDPEVDLSDVVLDSVVIGRLACVFEKLVPASLFQRRTCCDCGAKGAEHLFGQRWPDVSPGEPIAITFRSLSPAVMGRRRVAGAVECLDLTFAAHSLVKR